MTIVLTGVNGFIGQHLASRLIAKGHKVIGIGLEEKPKVKNLNLYIKGSILDKPIIEHALNKVNVVVHLAAITSHNEIVNKKDEAKKINLTGTENALDIFIKSNANKFIYPSTGKVYGKVQYLPIDEKHPTNPQNILGKSKLETEKLIRSYDKSNKQFIIFRVFNVYGSGQNENFLIPTILKQLSEEKSEITLGDINAKRDYIYIEDLIDAFILAIEQKISPGVHIYNICTGISKSALDIVQLITQLTRKKIKIKVNQKLIRNDESPDEYGSFELTKKELGWFPKTNLEKGLKIICK